MRESPLEVDLIGEQSTCVEDTLKRFISFCRHHADSVQPFSLRFLFQAGRMKMQGKGLHRVSVVAGRGTCRDPAQTGIFIVLHVHACASLIRTHEQAAMHDDKTRLSLRHRTDLALSSCGALLANTSLVSSLKAAGYDAVVADVSGYRCCSAWRERLWRLPWLLQSFTHFPS